MLEIRRREFITLLGGAVAAWPLTGRAEPTDRMRRIGVLSGCHERSRPMDYDRVRHHARQLDTVSAVALAIGV